jgi:hypothetical protein
VARVGTVAPDEGSKVIAQMRQRSNYKLPAVFGLVEASPIIAGIAVITGRATRRRRTFIVDRDTDRLHCGKDMQDFMLRDFDF